MKTAIHDIARSLKIPVSGDEEESKLPTFKFPNRADASGGEMQPICVTRASFALNMQKIANRGLAIEDGSSMFGFDLEWRPMIVNPY